MAFQYPLELSIHADPFAEEYPLAGGVYSVNAFQESHVGALFAHPHAAEGAAGGIGIVLPDAAQESAGTGVRIHDDRIERHRIAHIIHPDHPVNIPELIDRERNGQRAGREGDHVGHVRRVDDGTVGDDMRTGQDSHHDAVEAGPGIRDPLEFIPRDPRQNPVVILEPDNPLEQYGASVHGQRTAPFR